MFATSHSLRGDDSPQRVAARQNNSAVVDLSRKRAGNLLPGQLWPLGQRAAAGRAPVGGIGAGQHSVAQGTNALHTPSLREVNEIEPLVPSPENEVAPGPVTRIRRPA